VSPHASLAAAGLFLAWTTAAAQEIPSHRLTMPEARHPHAFSQLRGIRELASGTVLATDWIEDAVVALDFSGGTARAIGGAGRGPTEYRLPELLLPWPGDSTLLIDRGNSRLAVIGPDLRIHRSFSTVQPGTEFGMHPRGSDEAGRLYFVIPPWVSSGAGPSDSVVLARWDARTGVIERLTRLGTGPRPPPRRDRSPGIPLVLFAERDAWAAGPKTWVVVRTKDYHVEWTGADGSVTAGPAVPFSRVPVSRADKAAAVRAFLTRSPMSGRGPDGGMGRPPADLAGEDQVERLVSTGAFAEVHPPFTGETWREPNGRLWVARSTPAGSDRMYDVFDRRGRLQRRVFLPAAKHVVGLGRRGVYVVSPDDDGTETLERYSLPTGAGEANVQRP